MTDRPGELRIATWNLQSCARGLDRVAGQLRALEADIVALQEVDRCTRRARGIDQVARLAELAGFADHAFFPAIDWDETGQYGLGLLSRFRLETPITLALPTARGTEQRVMGTALVRTPHGALRVAVTHLSHRPFERALRLKQVAHIHTALAGAREPLVLAGDFNDLPGSETHRSVTERLRDLFDAAGNGEGGTHPFAPGVTLRIDYVFGCARVEPRRARVVKTDASDHHALVADVCAAN